MSWCTSIRTPRIREVVVFWNRLPYDLCRLQCVYISSRFVCFLSISCTCSPFTTLLGLYPSTPNCSDRLQLPRERDWKEIAIQCSDRSCDCNTLAAHWTSCSHFYRLCCRDPGGLNCEHSPDHITAGCWCAILPSFGWWTADSQHYYLPRCRRGS